MQEYPNPLCERGASHLCPGLNSATNLRFFASVPNFTIFRFKVARLTNFTFFAIFRFRQTRFTNFKFLAIFYHVNRIKGPVNFHVNRIMEPVNTM